MHTVNVKEKQDNTRETYKCEENNNNRGKQQKYMQNSKRTRKQ